MYIFTCIHYTFAPRPPRAQIHCISEVCICIRTYACAYINIHTYMYLYVRIYTHYIFALRPSLVSIHGFRRIVFVYVHTHVRISIYIHVCMYIYICIYTYRLEAFTCLGSLYFGSINLYAYVYTCACLKMRTCIYM